MGKPSGGTPNLGAGQMILEVSGKADAKCDDPRVTVVRKG